MSTIEILEQREDGLADERLDEELDTLISFIQIAKGCLEAAVLRLNRLDNTYREGDRYEEETASVKGRGTYS